MALPLLAAVCAVPEHTKLPSPETLLAIHMPAAELLMGQAPVGVQHERDDGLVLALATFDPLAETPIARSSSPRRDPNGPLQDAHAMVSANRIHVV